MWINKLCINQESDETKQAGVASFKDVLQRSENMVALISELYFSRMWSVYELAVFSKYHKQNQQKLLLLSLDWPGSISLNASVGLTDNELALLKHFRCKNARCFVPADRVTVLREIRALKTSARRRSSTHT